MDAVAVGVSYASNAVTASSFLGGGVMEAGLDAKIETRIAELGFELVELESAGSKARPILRIRIDRPNSDAGVTLDDCAHVSRELESFLDENPDISERYVLEVSSPGVERPLVKRSDYDRFAGKEVSLKTTESIEDLGKKVEGVLRGIDERGVVELDVKGRAVKIPHEQIKKAHLVFNWNDKPVKKE
jgi:ribosome maturation factor RimP